MGRKSLTRDEIFLCRLAKMAEALGDVFQEVDCYDVGRAIGQNTRSVDNIVRMLAQTNFVKKGEGSLIYLTSQGISLVEFVNKE